MVKFLLLKYITPVILPSMLPLSQVGFTYIWDWRPFASKYSIPTGYIPPTTFSQVFRGFIASTNTMALCLIPDFFDDIGINQGAHRDGCDIW